MYSVIELSYSPIFILCTTDDFSIFKNIDHTQITSKKSFPIYLTSTQFYFFKRGRIHALEFSLLSPSKKNYVRILPSTPKDLLYLCPKRTYQKDIFLLDLRPMACSILIYLKYHLYRTWSELPDDRWNSHSQNALSRKTLDRKSFAPKWQNVVSSFLWRTWRWQKQKAKSFRIRKPDFSAFFSGKNYQNLVRAKEWKITWSSQKIRESYRKFSSLCFIVEVMSKITVDEDVKGLAHNDHEFDGLFKVLSNACYFLDLEENFQERQIGFLCYFLGKLFIDLGIFPDIKQCQISGEPYW